MRLKYLIIIFSSIFLSQSLIAVDTGSLSFYGHSISLEKNKIKPTTREEILEGLHPRLKKIFPDSEKSKKLKSEVKQLVKKELKVKMRMYEAEVKKISEKIKSSKPSLNEEDVTFSVAENVVAGSFKDLKKSYSKVNETEFEKARAYYLDYASILVLKDLIGK